MVGAHPGGAPAVPRQRVRVQALGGPLLQHAGSVGGPGPGVWVCALDREAVRGGAAQRRCGAGQARVLGPGRSPHGHGADRCVCAGALCVAAADGAQLQCFDPGGGPGALGNAGVLRAAPTHLPGRGPHPRLEPAAARAPAASGDGSERLRVAGRNRLGGAPISQPFAQARDHALLRPGGQPVTATQWERLQAARCT